MGVGGWWGGGVLKVTVHSSILLIDLKRLHPHDNIPHLTLHFQTYVKLNFLSLLATLGKSSKVESYQTLEGVLQKAPNVSDKII